MLVLGWGFFSRGATKELSDEPAARTDTAIEHIRSSPVVSDSMNIITYAFHLFMYAIILAGSFDVLGAYVASSACARILTD